MFEKDWVDARLWIPSAEVREGGGEGGASLGEWEHNNKSLVRTCSFKGDTVCDHK